MSDVTIESVRAIVRGWKQEAKQRRRVTTIDPIADTLDYCAGEVEQQLATLEAAPPPLTVEAYAERHLVSVQTVRTWCRKGLLPAEHTAKGWMIPADAERVRVSA